MCGIPLDQLGAASPGDISSQIENNVGVVSPYLSYTDHAWSRTRFFGPHALLPTYDDVKGFLAELDDWRATAPQRCPARCPQQSDERKQGFYLQAVLLTMRPVLMQNAVDQNLLRLCAEKAAEACEVSVLCDTAGFRIGTDRTRMAGC